MKSVTVKLKYSVNCNLSFLVFVFFSKRGIFNGIYCNSDESGTQLCVNYSISLDDMSEELRSITTPRQFSTVAL